MFFIVSSAGATNSGDFSGAVAIGTGYAGTITAPTNGLIVQGSTGIGSSAPVVSLDLSQKNDALALPAGNTSQRPTGANGEIRYNTATNALEGFINGLWSTIGGAGGATPAQVSVLNGAMTIISASSTATFTADEIVVQTALGGNSSLLANYSEAVNLATTGAGAMDTGSPPNNGYVSLYAIYNPSNSATSILATNVTTSSGSVYTGTHMPTGYTASALISVWRTNSSGQFIAGYQQDRSVYFAPVQVLSVSATASSYTSFSISTTVPPNAKTASGWMAAQLSQAQTIILSIAANASAFGERIQSCYVATNSGGCAGSWSAPILTSQTLYYKLTGFAGTPSAQVNISGYTF
jgi:hypothetical protein